MLVVSDMHVGSTTAVCTDAPDVVDQGTIYQPNKLQQVLFDTWKDCIDELHQKPTVCVVNG